MNYPCSFLFLALLLSACSTLNENSKSFDDRVSKPDGLTIDKSIIALDNQPENNINNNKLMAEKKKLTGTQSVEQISTTGGFGSLSETAKIPPIFESNEEVTISVDSMPVVEFIHYVFGELLGLNYVISSQVESNKGKVSLSLTNAITKEALYIMSDDLLVENDIAMLRKDSIIYFQKKNKDKRYKSSSIGIGRSLADIPETTGQVIQIIPYVYTNSRSLSSVIKKLTGVEVSIDSQRKIVTATGNKNDIEEVINILNMLDVSSSTDKEIRLIDLAYIAPDTLIDNLKELLSNDGYEVGKGNDITFVPMPRLGAIVVYAVSLEAVERVELWSQKLDIAVAGNEDQFYVYRPQFNKAVDLQTSLGPIINSILEVGGGVSVGGPGGAGDSTATQGGPNVSNTSIMSVDEIQNALIFYTTADKYRKISQLLQKLDQLPGQVILDIVIAEISLKDNMSSGIDWFYDSNGQSAVSSGNNSNSLGKSLTADFLSSKTGAINLLGIDGDWRVAMNFIADKTDSKILSKPFLIVKDGESATINSGDSIPTITQTSTSDNDRVTNSVQYLTTGIQVSVTPTINAKGLINLKISMSTSKSGGGGLTPTITNRNISSNIFSADGQTVALGGLITENLDDTSQKVPLLGDLPILGKLFGSDKDDYSRSELIMLITTRIVKSVTEVDEFRDKIFDLYSFPLAVPQNNVSK